MISSDDLPPLDHERVQELMWQALQQPESERDAWLAAQDAPEAERAEAAALLAHHVAAGTRFDHPIMERPTESGERLLKVAEGELPETIGGYRILRRLGTGGMGSVYEAEQENPRRNVALKVMDRGLSSGNARRRFAFEAEALGRLRHPAIAQVYEAVAPEEGGATAPWFAMEYVPGALSITEWADARELGPHKRLMLFADVCDAVQHGHQNQVIHRDLKPANILVTDEGRPKIIDFGVARMSDPGHGTAGETMAGQLVGTLGSMAPEQILGPPDEIDTRADVYALGTVLYELLTGKPPYDLSGMSVPQASQVVTSQDPPRPSRFDRRLRGDLDAITLTAMERERDRRYKTASALAADVRRFLDHLPVSACTPSLGYQLRRFARRNTFAVGAAFVAFVALVVATVVSLDFAWQAEAQAEAAELARGQEALARADAVTAWGEERLQHEAAVDARAEAEAAQREAEAAHAEAEQNNVRLEATLRFLLEDVFERPFEVYESLGRNVSIIEALDLAAEGVDDIDDPWTQAEVCSFFGQVYLNLAQVDPALMHLRKAHALRQEMGQTDDARWNFTIQRLAEAEQLSGNYDVARALHEDVLSWGEDQGLVGQPPYARSLQAYATLLRDVGDLEGAIEAVLAAEALYSEVLGPAHMDTIQATISRATLLRLSGDPVTATQILPPAIDLMIEMSPAPEEIIAHAATELGSSYIDAGYPDYAEPMLTQAIAIRRRVHDDNHPSVAHGLVALANMHFARSEFDAATDALVEASDIYRAQFGGGHAYLAETLISLGYVQLNAGRTLDAVAPLVEAITDQELAGMGGSRLAVEASLVLSDVYERLQRLPDALASLERTRSAMTAQGVDAALELLDVVDLRVSQLRGADQP